MGDTPESVETCESLDFNSFKLLGTFKNQKSGHAKMSQKCKQIEFDDEFSTNLDG